VERLELIPKYMVHNGQEGLAVWIRTTWLPYTRQVPTELHSEFIHGIVATYIEIQGLDKSGAIPVEMVRLEFEAVRE
jgi:hypothetical protein